MNEPRQEHVNPSRNHRVSTMVSARMGPGNALISSNGQVPVHQLQVSYKGPDEAARQGGGGPLCQDRAPPAGASTGELCEEGPCEGPES